MHMTAETDALSLSIKWWFFRPGKH